MNGIIATQTIKQTQVIDATHPAIIMTGKFATGSAKKAGEILALNSDGLYVSYDPNATDSTKDPVAVLIEDLEQDQDLARVLVHGTVVAEHLLVQGSPATSEEIAKLKAITIYPI